MCIVFTKFSLTLVVSTMIVLHFEKSSRESNTTTTEGNAIPSFQESCFQIIHSDGRLSYSAGPSSQRVSEKPAIALSDHENLGEIGDQTVKNN